jgi:4'-phosphopantetheinyl transferase
MLLTHHFSNNDAEPGLEMVELYLFPQNKLKNDYTNFHAILSEEEKERAGKFVFEKDRITYVVSHGMLRNILSEKILIPPSEIIMINGKYGKPSVNFPNCHFNLSHAADLFAISYSPYQPVGVDTEKYDRNINWETIAKSYFHKNEIEYINLSDSNTKSETFFTFWTRKEAILKAIGCGIVDNLKEIDTTQDIYPLDYSFLHSINLTVNYPNLHLKSFIYSDHMISLAYPQTFQVKQYLTDND